MGCPGFPDGRARIPVPAEYCDRAVILERGALVHEAASAELRVDRGALETYLGVTDQGPRRGGKAAH